MTGNPKGLSILAKYSRLPIDRILYVPDASEQTVRSIRRGILFLMAFWSGSAVRAFSQVTQVVAYLDENKILELVVADLDDSPEMYEITEFRGKVHGHGEAAWVYDGKIIATSGMGLNTACFEPNTLALLAMS